MNFEIDLSYVLRWLLHLATIFVVVLLVAMGGGIAERLVVTVVFGIPIALGYLLIYKGLSATTAGFLHLVTNGRWIIVAGAVSIGIFLFGYYIWPTRYSYEKTGRNGTSVMRIDRLTGNVVIITPDYIDQRSQSR